MLCCVYSQQGYETGKVIDSIAVSKASNETFALYLPTTFKSDQTSSILVVFSPSGMGAQGVQVFKEAAETYNYILACSNDSKNGPYDRNFAITERLFGHLFSNFNIKEGGVYLAGFSGGSRLATAIASISGQIEGVIACGAGFSQISSRIPSTQKFSYAGICGDRDMNYKEMVDIKSYLNKLQFDNTLFTFDGGHKWPSSEQIGKAVDWLEMKSVKNGRLVKSKVEIERSYQKNYAFAKTVDEKNRPILALERFERLLSTYNRFFKLDSIVNQIQHIKKSNSFKIAMKSQNDAFEVESAITAVFIDRFNKDYERPSKANMRWWEREFQKLEKKKGNAKNEQMDKMFSRFKIGFFAMLHERQQFGNKAPTNEQKAFCEVLIAKVYPKGIID